MVGRIYFMLSIQILFCAMSQWPILQGKYHQANFVCNLQFLSLHCSKYLSEYRLPGNIVATTSASDALAGADFCFHAVPVQVLTVLYEALWFAVGVSSLHSLIFFVAVQFILSWEYFNTC
jgi:hypothetical protein